MALNGIWLVQGLRTPFLRIDNAFAGRDALTLLEALVARALNGREVDEHVVAVLTRDEAVPLLGVEELHRTRGQPGHFPP